MNNLIHVEGVVLTPVAAKTLQDYQKRDNEYLDCERSMISEAVAFIATTTSSRTY